MTLVFYHKFIWLKSRSRQAERERDLAEEANRLFKKEFGDKIESLQLEIEQLRKQRSVLELELKRERERKTGLHIESVAVDIKASPPVKNYKQQMKDIKRELQAVKEENVKLRTVLDGKESLNSSLSSQTEEEQDQSSTKNSQPSLCRLCKEEDSLTRVKKQCNNCREDFCENCLANELPLPSSINPVQVCTVCHKKLLKQYSSSPV